MQMSAINGPSGLEPAVAGQQLRVDALQIQDRPGALQQELKTVVDNPSGRKVTVESWNLWRE